MNADVNIEYRMFGILHMETTQTVYRAQRTNIVVVANISNFTVPIVAAKHCRANGNAATVGCYSGRGWKPKCGMMGSMVELLMVPMASDHTIAAPPVAARKILASAAVQAHKAIWPSWMVSGTGSALAVWYHRRSI